MSAQDFFIEKKFLVLLKETIENKNKEEINKFLEELISLAEKRENERRVLLSKIEKIFGEI